MQQFIWDVLAWFLPQYYGKKGSGEGAHYKFTILTPFPKHGMAHACHAIPGVVYLTNADPRETGSLSK